MLNRAGFKTALGIIFQTALFLTLLSLSTLASPEENQEHKTFISWQQVQEATSYELQVSPNEKMSPIVKKGFYKTTDAMILLGPGIYFFRVRGVTKEGLPGPWNEVEGFAVNANPPRQIGPLDGQDFAQLLPEKGIEFQWEPGIEGSNYILEIDDAQGPVLRRRVDTADFWWKPNGPGTFKWRVGFESFSRQEWGPFIDVTLEKTAFPPPKTITVTKTVTKTVVKYKTVDEFAVPDERPHEWWIRFRGGADYLNYSSQNLDTLSSGSGTSVSEHFIFEMFWRGPRHKNSKWNLSAGLDAEVNQESVFGNSFTEPRFSARVFYTRESRRWSIGPLLQLSADQTGITTLGPGGTPTSPGSILREGAGGGINLVYRATGKFSLGLIGIARYDLGSPAPFLPNAISGSLGYEGDLTGSFMSKPNFSIEARLRAIQQNLSWTSATVPGASSQNDLSIGLDIGLGFRL